MAEIWYDAPIYIKSIIFGQLSFAIWGHIIYKYSTEFGLLEPKRGATYRNKKKNGANKWTVENVKSLQGNIIHTIVHNSKIFIRTLLTHVERVNAQYNTCQKSKSHKETTLNDSVGFSHTRSVWAHIYTTHYRHLKIRLHSSCTFIGIDRRGGGDIKREWKQEEEKEEKRDTMEVNKRIDTDFLYQSFENGF